MPCFRCGVRQTDPERGPSTWRRGVRADRQVLICPTCQADTDWTSELDRCGGCDSAALVCRLGEIECRDCGHTREATPGEPAEGHLVTSGAAGLSEEVEAALSRVLKRGPAG